MSKWLCLKAYERRIDQIKPCPGTSTASPALEECLRHLQEPRASTPMTSSAGVQPICFENACWAYTVGAAIAIKKGVKTAAEAAEAIGDRPAGLLHPRLRRR